MAGRTPNDSSALTIIQGNSFTIADELTKEEAIIISKKLRDKNMLLKSEHEKVSHPTATDSEAAHTLVDYVVKKGSADIAKEFMSILKNELGFAKQKLAEKLLPQKPSSDHECTQVPTSAPSRGVDQGSVDCDQQPQLFATEKTANDETDCPSYAMESSPHGVCVIINNMNFPGGEQRKGSEKDAEMLEKTFSELGYTVCYWEDLDSTGLPECLQRYANYDHTRFDSFVCCILSHGGEGRVSGCDNGRVYIKNLMQKFVARKCRSLIGKPKLFFIQACQGKEWQQGASSQRESDELEEADDDIPVQKTIEEQQNVSMDWANFLTEALSDTESDDGHEERVADWADFLIGYATVPGYKAQRNTKLGTIYITKLCEVLQKHSHKEPLSSMLEAVNGEVSKQDLTRDGALVKQVPQFRSTLGKKLFFRKIGLPEGRPGEHAVCLRPSPRGCRRHVEQQPQ